MTITATIIADSCNEKRLTTLELRYPRFIHAEFMTHRVFSRNASSSRAIPVERLIEDVVRDTAMPIHWGKNQPGMQAREELDNQTLPYAVKTWGMARDRAVAAAKDMAGIGVHKQIVNRLLEPFSHINVVVTATDWDNFFALRNHPDAQPEIMTLARAMATAINWSTPEHMERGRWHLPYVTESEQAVLTDEQACRVSAARCARVSYKTHDGKTPLLTDDLALFDRLAGAEPKHLSPMEHQATPATGRYENFDGWAQFRRTL